MAFSTFFFVVRLHFWRLNFVIGTCPSPLFDQEQPDGAIRFFFFESTELFDLGERIKFGAVFEAGSIPEMAIMAYPSRTLLHCYAKRCYTGQVELKHRTKTQINTRAQLFEEHYYRLNPVLNFNLDFSFFCTKAFSRVIFAILQFRNIPSPHCRQR